ncbi:MAG: glycerophosphodiester phosphodiesterase [Candidatus Thiodiazotropha weberae]|uniref:glycerophosphodiester phosphodiesterase n=1 Tax=Candidatus Thiodiazotropha endoloripes TaxID=1818881 RepID=A0A1E2ULC6_9GAMM|nr:glycerophosphodiester phosphodiesterase family protein [Candidatus Thiodiazotropha endoloripes]MCG7900419.1 glycerophosphodiester phosphodiesterase [Candidatus Thiodiazotropha weberae]MCG7903307.1 glycerophosphodiester phosphodiesterase [Candidatus Thiodiazotropha weberae]MCG7915269.1 glycerophosphodiester phosphodiesterase [Candidatus Thiodiazotropha weberae]ODB90759.1 glycerophosphodiester phosphodiesterase [Candidatus Thiodiazotropha endoloripes]ODB94144.1 glycerophosphodiester phosphodi
MRVKKMLQTLVIITTTTIMVSGCFAGIQDNREDDEREVERIRLTTQLGPRPFYLVDDMDEGELKQELQECSQKKKFKKSDFSIGHRGAAMQFPEHTKESYVAAARMGAGILECDVTFTKDRELVCRHSQCDLHTTTNILATPLAAKCSQPFVPAEIDPNTGEVITPASARCCTSDITLEEFKTLQGKMDAGNRAATTVEEYLDATPSWRTDLYTGNGTLMTHAESIVLFKQLGAKMTPELKSPSVDMPYQGDYTQQDYAQQMIDEYKAAGVKPKHVFAQSFNLDDVLYWINHEPRFGKQAVYLDGSNDPDQAKQTIDMMSYLAEQGVNYLAPAMWALVTAENGEIVPSEYAIAARAHGIDLITWTLERSGLLASGGGWYYQSISDVTDNDGDMLVLLDVLAQDVGIKGIFSDWPATVTFYANCKGL